MDRIQLASPLVAPTPGPDTGAPVRRLVAAGILGRTGGRTIRTVRTEAGTIGTVTRAGQARTTQLVLAVARHLATHRPGDVMTETARLTVALGIAKTAPACRPLLRLLPFPTGGTRGEYALRLRRITWATPAGGAR
ncbi:MULTISPECIES: hypothetical protein [unclassified Streptomyces]|uniref:hypothetical protein n=1 Tax=unclassified Streptomyces TaxID=2593676 RepID=UPI0037FB2ACD